MKNDTPLSTKSPDPLKASNGASSHSVNHVVDSIEGSSATNGINSLPVLQNGTPKTIAEDKNESEADTEIESGKEDGSKVSSRNIKHEGRSDSSLTVSKKAVDSDKILGSDGDRLRTSASLKDTEASNSSILTSVVSSPSNEQSSRAGSENGIHSPSKTSIDSDTMTKNSKRKREGDEVDSAVKRKVKREESLAISPSRQRSDTPPSRRRRTASVQSASTPGNPNQQVKGRKKPPPIHTKSTQDPDSEDSSTSHAHSSHRKSASIQNARKMAPALNTAKFRDRNGRTLLAKACFSDNVDVVRERFQENPDHLDIKEYAENSPLQIASLRGEADIVKFLVDQGANVNTQNVQKDTPLIDAVENGHLEVIRILLDAGANPSQPNAKGEEPLELIPEDDEDFGAIRSLLLEAKEKYKLRRPSEPAELQPVSGKSRASVSLPSPKGSPSVVQGRHALEGGRSRRAQRGQSKRDDLLWIPATAARLQQAAGEGDAQATNHILSMGIAADSESVLAAAKGCHEDCLSLLMAFGAPEVADPDPIPGFKTGWDTPLLAAIGQSGENLNIIRILLGQPGFNPTRRLYQNKTYHEIAKDRAGPNTDEEHAILKKAHDDYSKDTNSPRKKKKQVPSAVSSPRSSQNENGQRKDTDLKVRTSEAKPRRRGSMDRPGSSSSRLQVPAKQKSRESSVAVSDREREPSPSRRDKRRRISSSSEEEDKVVLKQRKRLLTGKERREGAERKRRSSITSLETPRSRVQEEAKKLRASTSPAHDHDRNNVERKAPDPASLQKLRRQRSEQHTTDKMSAEKATDRLSNFKKSAAVSGFKSADIKVDDKPEIESEINPIPREENVNEREQQRRDKESADQVELERQAALQAEERKRHEELARKRQEEERAARRRAEEEARKIEEQKRQEAEAKIRSQELQRQKDEIRFPEAFYVALHEHPVPPTYGDLRDWLQLRVVTSRNLIENGVQLSHGTAEDIEWILNMQVAVLLGLKDLSLRSNERLSACEHVTLPPGLGAKCARWWTHTITPRQAVHESIDQYYARVKQNSQRFAALASSNELFFIRRQIFDQIASETSHLRNLPLQPGSFTFLKSMAGRSSSPS